MIAGALEGPVARIRLDRIKAHNALDQAPMRELRALLEVWAGRAEIRALVITGAGRSFCAGAALDADAVQARVAACFASADHAEGLAAQRARRASRFEGR